MNSSVKKRGLLIVFEGLDRSGKTTLTRALLERMLQSNRSATSIKFPNADTSTWHLIEMYQRKVVDVTPRAMHLIYSANRHEKMADLVSTLVDRQTHVVCDRYIHSGIAYSMAKGLGHEWCVVPDHGLVAPDIVVFVDTPVQECALRAGFGRDVHDSTEFQQRVYTAYQGFVEPGRWIVLDGTRPVVELLDQLMVRVQARIEQCEYMPIDLFVG